MKESFADRLSSLAPSHDALVEFGLTDIEANEIRNSVMAVKRPDAGPMVGDELVDLASRFDLSNIEIGMVAFEANPHDVLSAWQVGRVEADPLLVTKATGEVVVEERGAQGHVLWRAARDSASFLEAVLCVSELLTQRMFDQRSTPITPAEAERCAALAGGIEFRSFY